EALQRLQQRLAAGLSHAEGLRNRGGDQSGIADGSEIDEEDAVAELIQEIGGDLEGKAGLAGAARAGEGHQAGVVAEEELLHGGELLLSADQRRALGQEVVGPGIEAAQRREVGGKVRGAELVDALGSGEVPEAALAQ